MNSETTFGRPSIFKENKSSSRPPRGKGTDFAYDVLRDLIIRMELPPGKKVDESLLVKSLGISRTPLREALVRLSADRLVTISPNHGAHIAPLDALGLSQFFEALELTHRALQHWACLRRTDDDVQAITEAHEVYENAALTLDATEMSEANMEFHHTISQAAKNDFLAEYELKLSILGARIGWIWYRDYVSGTHNKEVIRTIDEHKEILAAIKARRTEDAELLATTHIRAFRDRVFEKLGHSLGNTIAIGPVNLTPGQE